MSCWDVFFNKNKAWNYHHQYHFPNSKVVEIWYRYTNRESLGFLPIPFSDKYVNATLFFNLLTTPIVALKYLAQLKRRSVSRQIECRIQGLDVLFLFLCKLFCYNCSKNFRILNMTKYHHGIKLSKIIVSISYFSLTQIEQLKII